MSVAIENLILTIVTRDKPLSLLEIEIASGAGRWSVNVALDKLYKDGRVDFKVGRSAKNQKCRMWFKSERVTAVKRAKSLSHQSCVVRRLWNRDVFAAT